MFKIVKITKVKPYCKSDNCCMHPVQIKKEFLMDSVFPDRKSVLRLLESMGDGAEINHRIVPEDTCLHRMKYPPLGLTPG